MAVTDNLLIAAIPSALDGGTAYTGQGAGEAAGGNHLDERPAKVTAVGTMTPRASTFTGEGLQPASIDWVAIVNHNLDRRRGSLWRAWLKAWTPGAYTAVDNLEELYPTGSADISNSTGAHTTVDDDPWVASGDYAAAAGAGAWSRRFTFDTPKATLSSVGNDHAFVVRAAVGTSPGNGTLTLKLSESGSVVATLLAAAQVGDYDDLGRVVYIARFSTSQLATASGANVELQIDAGNSVRVYSVLWIAGLDAGPSDSGFLEVDAPPASSEFGSVSAGLAGEEPTQNDFWTLSAAVAYSGSSKPKVSVAFVNGTNAATPVNKLGVLAAGKLWQPPANVAACTLAVEDASTKGNTLGGQDYGSNRRRRRVATLTLEVVIRATMLELFERIDWRKGRLGAFFVCLFPTDAYAKRISGFWATLGESEVAGAWEPYAALDGNDSSVIRWRRSYTFRERL